MGYRGLLYIVIFSIFLSCKKKSPNSYNRKKEKVKIYYSNGAVKAEYFEEGKVMVDSFFSYYNDGSLLNKGFYKEGELDGQNRIFYANGNLKRVLNYSEGTPYGQAYFYKPNGDLSEYSVYWAKDSKGYIREYDTTGSVIRDDGPAICHMKTETLKDSFIFKMPYARPPSTDTKIEAKLFFKGKRIENKLVDLSGEIGVLKTDNKVDSIVFIAEIMSLPAYNVFKSDTIIHAGF